MALNYLDKSLDGTTLAEMTISAALLKALNNYHPNGKYVTPSPKFVLGQAYGNGYITADAMNEAKAMSLTIRLRTGVDGADTILLKKSVARWLAMVTRSLHRRLFHLNNTFDPNLQGKADKAAIKGLQRHLDKRQGWRAAHHQNRR